MIPAPAPALSLPMQTVPVRRTSRDGRQVRSGLCPSVMDPCGNAETFEDWLGCQQQIATDPLAPLY
jgi:hypothetical protein